MSHADVYSAVNAVVPTAHMAWTPQTVPDPPWAVYSVEEDDPLFADNSRGTCVTRWRVDLVEKSRDPELERQVMDALSATFGPVTKSEYWFEKEKYLEVTYKFTEIGD